MLQVIHDGENDPIDTREVFYIALPDCKICYGTGVWEEGSCRCVAAAPAITQGEAVLLIKTVLPTDAPPELLAEAQEVGRKYFGTKGSLQSRLIAEIVALAQRNEARVQIEELEWCAKNLCYCEDLNLHGSPEIKCCICTRLAQLRALAEPAKGANNAKE